MDFILFFLPQHPVYKLLKYEHIVFIKKTNTTIMCIEFIGIIQILEITEKQFSELLLKCNSCYIVNKKKKRHNNINDSVLLNCSTFVKYIINADKHILTSCDLKKYLNNNFKSNWLKYIIRKLIFKILSSIFNKNEKICYFILLPFVLGKERLLDAARTLKLFF